MNTPMPNERTMSDGWESVLQRVERKARKRYRCDAYALWLNEEWSINDCETVEQKAVVEIMRARDGWIEIGEKYLYVCWRAYGGLETWRANVEMNKVCKALGFYD